MAETMTYRVAAISCAHCEAAIKQELDDVAGVDAVDVDLSSKLVTVRGSGISDEQLRAALEEAGYEAD